MQFKVKCSELLGTVKDSALLDGYLTLDDLKRIQAALSAPCLSRRTRSTENIPRSDSENEGHAKKKNIKNEADKPYAACLLLAMVRPAWATICGKD